MVALIPARGGSKELPGKNLKVLAGKPLLRWSIELAKRVPAIDRIYVSTDDEAVAREAREAGADVAHRPPELAGPHSLVMDAIRYHLEQWNGTPEQPGIIVLLQPTSPLRSVADVEASLVPLQEGTHDSVATFRPCATHPERLWRLVDESVEPFLDGPGSWAPRQELPDLYEINGAVYAFVVERLPGSAKGPLFGRIAPVLMPPERSIDIDDAFDFLVAEALMVRNSEDSL